ncbi:hypothetical protein SAMN05444273_101228 [Litoreibacter ascidiaceicola]|uniref:DUF2155 domain-containing protein n=1 Tax=Litoreibacter ascidiaceicola TaxID=1486859 RepID=A0A1M4SXR7_9RHOB|nr:DUF2155 domain-containing protein [Litoreibacter ascidiaceicola]SHE36995.1 hypothetical protein SAMN05444273_101228 [Litoreibacter ascidiaceicola]
MKRLIAGLVLLALPAVAQTTIEGDDTVIRLGNTPVAESKMRPAASSAAQAVMRGLDKLAGASEDIILTAGEATQFGPLTITMKDCRYPKGNPSGDAFVSLSVIDTNTNKSAFEGWMIASSPALNAMDHPRYDVWAIRCKLDDRTPSVVAGESSPFPIMRPEGLGGN